MVPEWQASTRICRLFSIRKSNRETKDVRIVPEGIRLTSRSRNSCKIGAKVMNNKMGTYVVDDDPLPDWIQQTVVTVLFRNASVGSGDKSCKNADVSIRQNTYATRHTSHTFVEIVRLGASAVDQLSAMPQHCNRSVSMYGYATSSRHTHQAGTYGRRSGHLRRAGRTGVTGDILE